MSAGSTDERAGAPRTADAPGASPSTSPDASAGGGWRGLVALVAVLGVGLLVGLRLPGAGGRDADRARSAASEGWLGAGVAALPVRTTDGRTLALADLRTPTVAIVVSTSCGVCEEALADFGRMAAGRPLPRLWVVTLEGADQGVAMTAAAGIRGAVHAGPPTPSAGALFTFQVQGTPTFLALDAGGRVREVLPGYPGREAMAGWLPVMAGTADRPVAHPVDTGRDDGRDDGRDAVPDALPSDPDALRRTPAGAAR